MQERDFVISLGGSVIASDKLEVSFLEGFSRIIFSEIRIGKRFVIITGGGKTARNYQEAAVKASHKEKDWLGIKATELNCLLLRAFFNNSGEAYDKRFKFKRL